MLHALPSPRPTTINHAQLRPPTTNPTPPTTTVSVERSDVKYHAPPRGREVGSLIHSAIYAYGALQSAAQVPFKAYE